MVVTTVWPRRLFALAAAAALVLLGGGPALAQNAGADEGTEAGETAPGLSAEQALALAREGSQASVAALMQYLSQGAATPDEIAARASALVEGLGGEDLEAMQIAADAIARAAENALSGARVVRFDVDPNYQLAEGAIGFDFGTADAKLLPGFERVTTKDERIEGDELSAIRRPSESPVISDGLLGVKRFKTAVANGRYRIILMTEDLGEWQRLLQPLGASIRINGIDFSIAGGNPEEWASQAYLGALTELAGAKVQMTGGMLVIEFEVTNGELNLEFLGDHPTYLTGLVVEPASVKPTFVALNPAAEKALTFDPKKVLDQQVKIAEAIGKAIQQVVTEAGEKVPSKERPVSPS